VSYDSHKPPGRPKILWVVVVVFALLAITTVFVFVENSHGLNEWEQCKRELEAHGEKIDWADFVPPPIPAESNSYAAPKMTDWFVRQSGVSVTAHFVHSNTSKTFLTTNEANAYLDETDEDFATDFQLVRTALQRPFARIDGDYSKPFEISMPNFVSLRNLAQMLAQRVRADFLLGHPDDALHELTLMHDLSHLLLTKPDARPYLLVTAMINVAITGLYTEVIVDGFRAQAWSESEIKALAAQLAEINLPPTVAASLRAERAASCHTLATTEPGKIMGGYGAASSGGIVDFFKNPVPTLGAHMPHALVLQNMVTIARLEQMMIDSCEAAPGLVVPAKLDKAARDLDREFSGSVTFSPSKWMAAVCIPNYTRALQTAARNQTKVNQARVACALELYRLKHSEYPEKLEALVPEFIAHIPHDLIGGKPFHYRRLPDGKFLLYSLGWNEKDDGGSVTLDWLWGDVAR
jgi:hypothetical protein